MLLAPGANISCSAGSGWNGGQSELSPHKLIAFLKNLTTNMFLTWNVLILIVECCGFSVAFWADEECSDLNVDLTQCSSYWSSTLVDKIPGRPPLLVVSLDGFRNDYFDRLASKRFSNGHSSGLLRLARCGVRASSMVPVFPTTSLPNHYSIVTGLYPESHGIVADEFYDPTLRRNFSLPAAGYNLNAANMLDPVWFGGETIWHTIKTQGKKSASYFWPGSFINDPEKRPDYWVPFDQSISFKQRIDTVVQWLLMPPGKRPSLITLYYEEPRVVGQHNGPDSNQTDDKLKEINGDIDYLLESLGKNNILGCVNMIVLSGHGMVAAPRSGNALNINTFFTDKLSKFGECYDCQEGIIPSIRLFDDSFEKQDEFASKLDCKHDALQVYHKWDLPRRLHHAASARISNLVMLLNATWRATTLLKEYYWPGGYGWDSLNPDLFAIFIAQGPSFVRDGRIVDPFCNIELYNLMCRLAGVQPTENNGTVGALHHVLRYPPVLKSPPDGLSLSMESPEILLYPADNIKYLSQVQNRKRCRLVPGLNNPIMDSSLNLSQSDIGRVLLFHAPLGMPVTSASRGEETTKILANNDFIIGFDVKNGLPLWVSYTVDNQSLALDDDVINSKLVWRYDPRLRIEDLSVCDRLDDDESLNNSNLAVLTSLYPDWMASSLERRFDSAVETNAVDVSPVFEKYWDAINRKIVEASWSSGKLNVVAGPLRNSPSPALFLIASRCNSDNWNLGTGCAVDDLDVQSFILPTHLRYGKDCLEEEVFLRGHLASVRDIQQATGISFFPVLPHKDRVRFLSRTVLSSSLLIDPLVNAENRTQELTSRASVFLCSNFARNLLLTLTIICLQHVVFVKHVLVSVL